MGTDFDSIHHLSVDIIHPSLREVHKPPEKLFVKGDTSFLTDTHPVAFVGSRMCSSYGKMACEKLIQELASYPVSIVSGLALGIDTIAHKKALEVGLCTAAVVGSGLGSEVLYPKSHLYVAQEIVSAGGCIISEYPEKQRSAPYMFPERNRLIAGIASVIIIVECEKKSGTMITARLGIESNKEVCVVPHSIFSLTGEGPLSLLKNGAHPVVSGDDIAEILGLEKNASFDALHITDEEKKVLSHLSKPLSKNALMDVVDMPVSTLQQILIQLEIKGVIKEHGGLLYVTL